MAADGVAAVTPPPHCRDDHPRRGARAAGRALLPARAAASSTQASRCGCCPPARWTCCGASRPAMRTCAWLVLPARHRPAGGDALRAADLELREPAVRAWPEGLPHPACAPRAQPDLPARLRRLAELVRRGTLVQVTASSLRAPRGSRSATLAHRLVRRGHGHVISSDAHGPALPRPRLAAPGGGSGDRARGHALGPLARARRPAGAWSGDAVAAGARSRQPERKSLLRRMTG